MWESTGKFVSDPWVSLAFGVLLLVIGGKMTSLWSNALLVFAWAILVVAVLRAPVLATETALARVLWATGVASILGLGIYYGLWTDLKKITLGVEAVSNRVAYPPGTTIAGIAWHKNFVELRIALVNKSRFPYTDVDLDLFPDEPIAEAAQSTSLPNFSLWAIDTSAGLQYQHLVMPTGERIANPLVLIGTTAGYRLRCDMLPANSRMEVVFALARFMTAPPKAPQGNLGAIFDKDYVLQASLDSTRKLWYGHLGKSESVFDPGAFPKTVKVAGSFSVSSQAKQVARDVEVLDFVIHSSPAVQVAR